MAQVYAQTHKKTFLLTEKLGVGGEGTVFAWPSDLHFVCKVYHDPVLQERGDALTRKLMAMLASPPEDPMFAQGKPTFAWPKELVFDPGNTKRLVGFVMPRIHASEPLHKLYSPADRKLLAFPKDREGRTLEYYYMVAAARNLAEAFRLLHDRGYVMADVNEDNIRFRTDATISLIDNDSFQVRDRGTGETFLVPVLKTEYWPADSLQMHNRGEALTVSHDQFCLALFVFKLLMNGFHPFDGMSASGAEPLSVEENMAAGRFPFVAAHSGGQRPPYPAPAYDGLPAELRELFRSCFVDGARTLSARADAGAWVKALDRSLKAMKRCPRRHLYFTEARECPWCALEDALISCPTPGHKRYYRAQGRCPQCVLEERRASRLVAAPGQAPNGVSGPVALQPAPQRAAIPAPPVPATRQPAAPIPILSMLQRFPKATRWRIAGLLAAILIGAGVWGPLHLFGSKDGPVNSTATAGNSATAAAGPLPQKPTRSKLNPKDGANMVLIPAGEFQMGDADQNDNPPRKVKLTSYWIYRNDVTVGEYKKFCKATGRQMPTAPGFDSTWSQEDHPIVNVSWDDATAYCKWAGVSLPTEEQWEKAARGTDGRKYPWGNSWDANKCANFVGQSLSGTVAVGQYNDSPYGLSDMAGNVWQWCADWYDPSKYTRVLRGGSWSVNVTVLFRSSNRNWYLPDFRYNNFGFRGAAAGL